MSEWSAIAYGRTYEVDYRFLAIPKDFTLIDQEWAKKYILATMHHRENLKGDLRWSMFKNQKYCVIGLTYRISDLITQNDNIKFEIRYDNQNRYVYVFVGYVAKLHQDKKLDCIPYFLGQTFASLRALTIDIYNEKWILPDYDLKSRQPIIYLYKNIFNNNVKTIKLSNYCLHLFKDIDFSINSIKIPIRLHNQNTSTELWKITAEYILISQYIASNKDISLYINAEDNNYIFRETPFTMATVRRMVDDRHQRPVNSNKDFNNYNYNQQKNISLVCTQNVSEIQNKSLNQKLNLKHLHWNRKKFISYLDILFIIQFFFIEVLKNLVLPLFKLEFLPIIFGISCGLFILGFLGLFLLFDIKID